MRDDDGVGRLHRRNSKGKEWQKRLKEAAEGGSTEGTAATDAATAARMLRQLQAWETRPPGPCDKYNSIASRFLTWQTRRRECNLAPGNCVFMGRSLTGWCVPEEEAALYESVMPRRKWSEEEEEEGQGEGEGGEIEDGGEADFFPPNDPEGPMVETELLQSLVTIIRQEGIEQPVRLLITGSLAEAMTDSLRDGQSGTQELAKELVMEVLADPNSAAAVQHLLMRPELAASLRGLVHPLLLLPFTKRESHRLLKQQLDWLMVRNPATEQSLGGLGQLLLRLASTRAAIASLLSWSLSPSGPLPPLVTDLTSDRLVPLLAPATTGALTGAVHEALEDEYIRELAKDTMKGLLLRVAKMHAAAAAAAAAEARRREDAESREVAVKREEEEEGEGGHGAETEGGGGRAEDPEGEDAGERGPLKEDERGKEVLDLGRR